MKLADRMSLLAAEGAYAVLSRAQELERRGKSIIHFEIGQPDFATPVHITNSGIAALRAGKTKYTSPLGIVELRDVIARFITKTHGIETTRGQVAVTPSGKTAIFAAFAATISPGDEVMYPDPGFPTYRTLIDFFGGIAVPVPLVAANHFSFDMSVFRKRFSKRTRVVVLNSPSNPTGGVIPKSDIEEIASMVKHTDAWVVTDEMYSRMLYGSVPYASIYSLPKMKRQTIIVDGFSKTYAMTGWRLGYMVVPDTMIDRIDYLLTHLVGCTASFVQEAGIAALTGSQRASKRMVGEFHERRDIIVRKLNRISGIRCQVPDGAFYVFPDVSSFGMTSEKFASYVLSKAGVAVLPGTAFGNNGQGYIRISYAAKVRDIEEGVNRISRALSYL
ncbi:pyridoxal phosphate-dependent aminotransferase [Candidatus Gottesmanbacteria bacterium]|nr:pyridoxal phosphate-dependent aminotransferase [Candidatus Gottesmanbacteria bacterium]